MIKLAKEKKKHFNLLKLIIFVILIIASVIAYGFFIEPKLINVNEEKITITNLTDNFDGFKIVQISDLHYGKTFNQKSLQKLVKSINEQKPDIVVLTGDLIDKKTYITAKISEKISKELNKIETTSGKYAISGEDDLKFDEWINIIQNSGFTDLNNTYDTIYKKGYVNIFIAGASALKNQNINDKLKTSIDYLNSFETNGPIYKVLLVHKPDDITDLTVNPFNLILAGHNHGGEISIPKVGPLIHKTGAKKYYNNHYTIENSDLYISNGLGSIYNFRLFNTPSYNVYRLTKN